MSTELSYQDKREMVTSLFHTFREGIRRHFSGTLAGLTDPLASIMTREDNRYQRAAVAGDQAGMDLAVQRHAAYRDESVKMITACYFSLLVVLCESRTPAEREELLETFEGQLLANWQIMGDNI